MIHIEIIAVGKMRDSALLSLWDDYRKRLRWPCTLYEIEARKTGEEEKKILEKINPRAFVFVMDEHGQSLPSLAFAKKLEDTAAGGISPIQFVIGGADGLSEIIREKADFLLSFGAQTWPHMLIRIMLAEQIYRAQQILAGHPYHRE